MDEELELDPEQKAMVIAAASFICILVAIITACFAAPCCWGYKYLQRRRKNSRDDEIIMLEMPKKRISVKLNEKLSPLYQSESYLQVRETQNNFSPTPHGLFNGSCRPMTFPPPVLPKLVPSVKLHLSFAAEEDITSMGRLLVKVINAENVPGRDYPVLPDSFIKLEIIHKRWTLSRHEKVTHEVQSRVVRSASSPLFEQNFTFAASKSDIKNWCIKVRLFDDDSLTYCRETCCGSINLRDIEGLGNGSLSPVNLLLEPVTANVGQLQVAVSYLPTSQRLSVSVINAAKLMWSKLVFDQQNFHPCVKVLLLDHSGKILKRKRLGGTTGPDGSSFSGSACFQISPMVYETATLLLVVYVEKLSGKNGADEKRKKDTLGFAALGWMVNDETGRDHWRTALQVPRRIVSQWHVLR